MTQPVKFASVHTLKTTEMKSKETPLLKAAARAIATRVSQRFVSLFFIALAIVLCFVTAKADASIQIYGSRALFDAAVGGQTLIDFEAQNPGGSGSVSLQGSNLTIGPVSFTQADSRLYVLGEGVYNTAGLSSSYLNHNGAGFQNVIINFDAGGTYSLGIDIGQLYPFFGPVGSLTLNLSSGDVINLTGLQQLSSTSNTLQFVGFTSNVAINSISIDDVSASLVIDNFAYSYTANATVPEPLSLLVWAGLASVAGLVRSRRRE